jgi:hypothetical protein
LKRPNLHRKWSTIPKAAPARTKQAAVHNQPSRLTAWRLFVSLRSRFFELARVFVRFDHVPGGIVNALFLIETVLSR